jgi:hypothetical protein
MLWGEARNNSSSSLLPENDCFEEVKLDQLFPYLKQSTILCIFADIVAPTNNILVQTHIVPELIQNVNNSRSYRFFPSYAADYEYNYQRPVVKSIYAISTEAPF